MRARTTLTLLAVLLLAVSGLGLGVARATAELGRPHPERSAAPVPHRPSTTRPSTTRPTPAPVAAAPVVTTPVLSSGPRLLGPGDHGPTVRALQARMRQIGWFAGDVTDDYGPRTTAAVRGFQAKRRIPVTGYVDRRTQRRLEAMTHAPTAAELTNAITPMGNVPGPLDGRCRTGRVLCVDKTSRTLRFVVDGAVRRTVDVRFGASYTPTREGLFHVYWKHVDHVSTLYGSAMPYAMFFSRGQAVHYSSDFAARGYAGASHGCVNVRDLAGIRWLFAHVRVGDAVVVYRS